MKRGRENIDDDIEDRERDINKSKTINGVPQFNNEMLKGLLSYKLMNSK